MNEPPISPEHVAKIGEYFIICGQLYQALARLVMVKDRSGVAKVCDALLDMSPKVSLLLGAGLCDQSALDEFIAGLDLED